MNCLSHRNMFSFGVLLTLLYKKELVGEVKQPKKPTSLSRGERQCKPEVLTSSLHYGDMHKLHLKKIIIYIFFLLACSEFALIPQYVLDKVLTFSKR